MPPYKCVYIQFVASIQKLLTSLNIIGLFEDRVSSESKDVQDRLRSGCEIVCGNLIVDVQVWLDEYVKLLWELSLSIIGAGWSRNLWEKPDL